VRVRSDSCSRKDTRWHRSLAIRCPPELSAALGEAGTRGPRGRTPGALTSSEKEELQQLRRENRRLKMERDILKKAAAFFAKENT